MGEQFTVDKVLDIVDDHHHDSFGHHVTCGFGDDAHVRID